MLQWLTCKHIYSYINTAVLGSLKLATHNAKHLFRINFRFLTVVHTYVD